MPSASAGALAGKSAWKRKQNTKWDELLCSGQVRLNPIIGYANTEIAGEIILKEIDQVLRSKELELSQVEVEVQSLRIVAELLGEEADQKEARKLTVRYQD
jgi:hypothetical protein